MKNIKNNHSKAGQSSAVVKKPNKHDANLQKNTTLYFQIGLILCLLSAYLLLEMRFEDKSLNYAQVNQIDDDLVEVTIDQVKVYKEPVAQKEPIKKKQLITNKITVKEDITEAVKDLITSDEPLVVNEPVKVEDLTVIDEPEDVVVNIIAVEVVPIFPGCERAKTNDARRQCMSDKINRLVKRKFNTDLASEYGLSGKQKIDVQFTIDKNGNVSDIKTRAPHKALEKEARRVINKIPAMQPGRMNKKPVGVVYQLPINFQVQD